MTAMAIQQGGEPLLQLHGLRKAFGGIAAVKDIGFEVHRGEIVGLIGPNGAGKTTCFNLITGFYRPDGGTVLHGGDDVTGMKPHAMARRGIVRSFQKTNVLKNLSVFENILAGHYLGTRQSLWRTFFPGAKVRQAEREARVSSRHIAERLGLTSRIDTMASLLSCGELRLLEVAVALAARPQILMLDEPAAGLNSQEARNFGEVLKRLRGDLVQSILLVEHNMGLVMGVSDRVVVMHFGEKLAEGSPAQIQADRRVVEAYLGRGAAQ